MINNVKNYEQNWYIIFIKNQYSWKDENMKVIQKLYKLYENVKMIYYSLFYSLSIFLTETGSFISSKNFSLYGIHCTIIYKIYMSIIFNTIIINWISNQNKLIFG